MPYINSLQVEMDRFWTSPFTMFQQLTNDDEHPDISNLAHPHERQWPLHLRQESTIAPILAASQRSEHLSTSTSNNGNSVSIRAAYDSIQRSRMRAEDDPKELTKFYSLANDAPDTDSGSGRRLPTVFLDQRYWACPG